MINIDQKTCLSLYRMSHLIRRTQEILIEEYSAKQEMRCPMHFCVGQEAAPAALSPLLQAEDYIISHYRSHGYYLAKGAPLSEMIAEFHGKATGSNSGAAGSAELGHDDSHFFSGAIVGGPVGIAMGMAYAMKYRGAPGIAISVIGDGALDEGVSHEALNLAALHAVPLLTICENNLYAAHTPEATRTMSRSLIERVRPIGMPAEQLDGTDIGELHTRLNTIVSEIRCGAGPRFIEIKTYRYCGHVGPENDDWLGYRTADEIAAWRKRDPIPLLRMQARKLGIPEETLLNVEAAIETEISAAFDAARRDDFPGFDWSLAQVWANSYSPIITKFSSGGEDGFDSRQAETPLKPY